MQGRDVVDDLLNGMVGLLEPVQLPGPERRVGVNMSGGKAPGT